MWIIVATVIFLYLLAFLFICFLNAEKSHENPSTSDNNNTSPRASNNHSENESPSHSHCRFLFSRLFSSNFHREQLHSHSTPSLSSSNSTSQRQTPQTFAAADPSRSALFAYRQQQLRQIHHEITEMSYLLGASQSESDENRTHSMPVNISLPCPLTNLLRVQPLVRDNRYSFIHQLSMIPSDPGIVRSTCSVNMVGSGGSEIAIPYPYNGRGSPSSASSSVVSYSPGVTESGYYRSGERQRILRHIRMELEGLSLQLTHPTTDGATMGLDHNSGDSHSLIYFGNGETGTPATRNGWTQGNNGDDQQKDHVHVEDDDLPGYESIVCLLNAPSTGENHRIQGDFMISGSSPMEESPPPSYSEALHLHSICDRRE